MIELGNWVKINIDGCTTPSCPNGHPSYHHNFDGQHGVLEEDTAEYVKENPHSLTHPVVCYRCDVVTGFLVEEKVKSGHIYVVCFNGEHAGFTASELEDLGDQATFITSVVEAVGQEQEVSI